jgi:DNA-binding Lrp family transcriptional regulator
MAKDQDNYSKDERLEQEAECWQLHVHGIKHPQTGAILHGPMTEREIADHLRLTQPTVHRRLKKAARRIEKSCDEMASIYRARSVARCEYLYNESIAGYERSKKPVQSRTLKLDAKDKVVVRALLKVENNGQDVDKLTDEQFKEFAAETRYTQNSVGDARFLQTALQAEERLDKLTGADAPIKTALTDGDGNDVNAVVEIPVSLGVEEWITRFGQHNAALEATDPTADNQRAV